MKKPRGSSLLLFVLLFVIGFLPEGVFSRGQHYASFVARTPLPTDHYLILGFMGGRDRWDDDRPAVRKLALKIRSMNLPCVHMETVENTKRRLALELVKKALDQNRDGQLDREERASARLILYGQSFGGAAVVKFARQLKAIEVPVLLTVQIDSVGRNDALIPSNVAQAANLFQRNGIFIRGEPEIRPEDPQKTKILGNFKFDYRDKKIDLSDVPWFKKAFRIAHTKMEHDPAVWAKVEELILPLIDCRGVPGPGASTANCPWPLIRPPWFMCLRLQSGNSEQAVVRKIRFFIGAIPSRFPSFALSSLFTLFFCVGKARAES